jgi:hypothetical protein
MNLATIVSIGSLIVMVGIVTAFFSKSRTNNKKYYPKKDVNYERWKNNGIIHFNKQESIDIYFLGNQLNFKNHACQSQQQIDEMNKQETDKNQQNIDFDNQTFDY